MRFTAQEEYGLRCLLQMARHEDQGAMTIPEIARQEGLSVAYVGKLMRILREAGLVDSTRGQQGGYTLVRPSERISLAEIIAALGGQAYTEDHCSKFTGNEQVCVHQADCSIRSALSNVYRVLEQLLRQVSLKDLMRSETGMSQWIATYLGPQADVAAAVPGRNS